MRKQIKTPRKPIGFYLAAAVMLITPLLFAQRPATPAPGGTPSGAARPASPTKPDYPPHTEVFKDYKQVVSTLNGVRPLVSIWTRKKDNQVLAALPRDFAKHRFYLALTVAAGERYAGLQAGEEYFYIKQIGKRLAFIRPNLEYKSTGDQESKDSVKRLFTDQVMLDIPIVTIYPGWGPVIDLDQLFVGQASKFFGYAAAGINSRLAVVKNAKSFQKNVEIAFEAPVSRGTLKTFHYSLSTIPPNTGYKPRKADNRVGYFTTSHVDLGKYQDDKTRVRYINRWKLDKADPKLAVSPPVAPIKFYIEHTTPIRYRRWVREGVLKWNKAFEKIGLDNAIEVYYQDKKTGAHMEKDPEDVQYNFVRWLNNNVGTALGPSRVDPNTGQILDADIILTDGWIRQYWNEYNEILPDLAVEGFSPRTLAWFEENPSWDPRLILASPEKRQEILDERARRKAARLHGQAFVKAKAKARLIGDDEFDGLLGRTSQVNGFCRAADCKALDLATMRMMLEIEAVFDHSGEGKISDTKEAPKTPEKPKANEPSLDGVPEWFVGPLIAELVAHEVGHTIGLRHNFKASSIYTLEEINGNDMKGKKPFASSVMDHLPINMDMRPKEERGDHTMIDIGPYDEWAIEYGYSFTNNDGLQKILARNSDPLLVYGTDEDTYGVDPYARRYDFGKDPLAYAKNQIKLANYHRERIIDKFVKDGDSWAKARRGYELTISLQMRATSMMANWIGGAFVSRAHKGDNNAPEPIRVVPAEDQRDALSFVLNNTFNDEAWGITPELLRKMSIDKWLDGNFMTTSEAAWPVHDRIMAYQRSTLSSLMNPQTLGRVYDNEFFTPEKEDMVTLPELLETVHNTVWNELDAIEAKKYTSRQPAISSLRRNLQSTHLERLIDLTMDSGSGYGASDKPASNLAMHTLRGLKRDIDKLLGNATIKLDPYSESHLNEASVRIAKALDAQYIYNAGAMSGGGGAITLLLGNEADEIDR